MLTFTQTLDEVQLLLAVMDESVDRTNLVLESFAGDVNAQLVAKVIKFIVYYPLNTDGLFCFRMT